MDSRQNSYIIERVKEITIAKMSSSNTSADATSGKDTADFMQAVYDKLVELYEKC